MHARVDSCSDICAGQSVSPKVCKTAAPVPSPVVLSRHALRLLAWLVPWLVPDRPAVGRCTVHSHVPGRSCGLGGKRGGAVAQHPAHDDLARSPLVPVRAALRVVATPPVRTLHPHDGSLEHTFEQIYINRAGLEADSQDHLSAGRDRPGDRLAWRSPPVRWPVPARRRTHAGRGWPQPRTVRRTARANDTSTERSQRAATVEYQVPGLQFGLRFTAVRPSSPRYARGF
jgi:hypothetical protein